MVLALTLPMMYAPRLCEGEAQNGAAPRGAPPQDKTDGEKKPDKPAKIYTIDELQELMTAYYGPDPGQDLTDRADKAVLAVNSWMTASYKELEAGEERLNAIAREISGLGSQAEELERQLKDIRKDVMSQDELNAYNLKIRQINALADRQKGLQEAYGRMSLELRGALASFENEQKTRARQIEEFKTAVERRLAQYTAWHNSDSGEAFFQLINTRYAQLHQEKRAKEKAKKKEDVERLNADIKRLRALRGELGSYARRSENARENGLIIVPARLDGEDAYFIVDTGATVTTITPALVQALGLGDKLGPEMTVTLAAGIKVKGPGIILPRLSVFGKEARLVKAVVVEPSMAGVDGLLGHSFLSQFDYHIDRVSDPKLKLDAKTAP